MATGDQPEREGATAPSTLALSQAETAGMSIPGKSDWSALSDACIARRVATPRWSLRRRKPIVPVAFLTMPAIDVTDATFEHEVMERSAEVPVVVDLWAPWCGPCRTLGPIIEQVVDETDGKVELVKVNVDENPQISQAFGVQSIPLVVAVKDGQPIDGFLGAHPEATVRRVRAAAAADGRGGGGRLVDRRR